MANSIPGRLDGFIERIGQATSWLYVVLIGVIIIQVVLRYIFKSGMIILEELQWHLYAACIMIARRTKAKDRKGKILLIDGAELFRRGRNQNTLEAEHVEELMELYTGFTDVNGKARVVTLDEVRTQGGNLNLAGYITKPDTEKTPSVEEATAALKAALDDVWAAESELERLLAERGLA